jgi:hypothetical protein
MSDDIGFSVACHKGDVPLLRGCLASIRYFAPDAPICLVIDTDFDSRPFEKRYGVTTIRRRDVRHPGLRQWSFGPGITKLIAFWEAPFERIFHIDADAVLWGDVRQNVPDSEWDVVFNEPHEQITDYIQRTQYFDPQVIFDHIESFPWQGNPYFQAGVLCVRRGALDVDEYLRMLEGQRKNPDVFINMDQGILNILVFRAVNSCKIHPLSAHLQSVVPVLSKPELESRFQIRDGKPVPWVQPTVVHWAGPKPYKTNPDVFSLPMDYFREIGMREFGLPKWFPTKTAMQIDEFLHRDVPRTILNAKQTIKKVIGRK